MLFRDGCSRRKRTKYYRDRVANESRDTHAREKRRRIVTSAYIRTCASCVFMDSRRKSDERKEERRDTSSSNEDEREHHKSEQEKTGTNDVTSQS